MTWGRWIFVFAFCGYSSALLAENNVNQAEENAEKAAQQAHIYYYPREVIFWNVAQGDERKKRISLRQADQHPLSILDVMSENKNVEVKLTHSGGKDRKIFSLDVHLKHTDTPGSVETQIKVLTDHPLMPELIIPVYWNVLAGMQVDPPAFGVRLTRSQREAGGVIQISSAKQKTFTIDKIDVLLPGVTTDIRPMPECCGYYIAVLVSDPKYRFRKSEESSMVIHTSDEEQKMIVIPVMVTAPVLARFSEQEAK